MEGSLEHTLEHDRLPAQPLSAEPSRVRAARWYVYGVSAVALAALAAWSYLLGFSFSWLALGAGCVLAVVCVVSSRLPVGLGVGKVTFDVPDMAILVALVLGGPLCALLVAVPAMLQKEWLRTAFDAATLTIQILAAGYVFALFSGPVLSDPTVDSGLVWGILAAGSVMCLLDALIGPVLLWIKYGTPPGELLREVVLPPFPSDAISVLTVLATSLAMARFGPVAPLALFGGGALSLVSMGLVREHRERLRHLENENVRLREGMSSSNLEFAARLVQSIELKDGRTARLAAASAVYATDVAEELRLEPARAEKLKVAALLQDVGLVSVPDEVLLTPPGKLNSVGKMHLQDHPVRGERMLSAIPGFGETARWVRCHHEREDGTGYPDRLRGEWIPLEAKILATASLYACLVLEGPSRPGLSPQEARRELVGFAGGALDRVVVKTFLRVLDGEDENYALASDDRFGFPADPGPSTAAGAARHLRVAGEAEAG